jgi:hypothetical protein
MANVQSAYGFQEFGYLSGGAPDYQHATRSIQSSNATKIYRGDPVVKSGGTNYIVQGANNTTTLEGIFMGCVYIPTGGGTPLWSPFWPGAASVDATAFINNSPNALFRVAALSTSIVTANIGENVGFAIGTGSTSGGGFSGATVDQSTLATTNTLPFQIYSLFPGIGNGSDPTTNYGWCIVSFNNQRFKQLQGVA